MDENNIPIDDELKTLSLIKGNTSLIFEKIKSLRKNTNLKNLGNKTSVLANILAELGIVKQISSGIYKATVSASQLSKYSDGTVSSIIRVNGKIADHAGFTQIAAGVFTPALVFQAMSMVTGQYYLNGITNQLNVINGKLDYLIKLDESNTFGTLGAINDTLINMSGQKYFHLEDFIKIDDNIQDLNAISKKYNILNVRYFDKIQNINLEEISSDRNSKSWFSKISENSSSKIVGELASFQEERVANNMIYYLLAENLMKQYSILKLKANLKFVEPDINRLGKIRELSQNIENFGELEYDFTKSRLQSLNQKLTPYLDTILQDVSLLKNKSTLDKVSNFKRDISLLQNKLNEAKNDTLYLKNKFKEKFNVYLEINEAGEEQFYLEK